MESPALSHLEQQLQETSAQLTEELATIQYTLKKQLPLPPSTYDQVAGSITTLISYWQTSPRKSIGSILRSADACIPSALSS